MTEGLRRERVRVGILFGGRSKEHAVSLASAASVFAAIDCERYEPIPIGITPEGKWLLGDGAGRLLTGARPSDGEVGEEVVADLSHHTLVPARHRDGSLSSESAVDVVFPVLHGPYGEDGTIQGMLRVANIPFVGSDVLASALAMDKGYMKDRFAFLGLPQPGYVVLTRRQWEQDEEGTVTALERQFPYPMFVKPCNLGSSVGISKAHHREELRAALSTAAGHDSRVIVEEGIDAWEVECGVIGNEDPSVSVFGQVIAHREWYDYDAKYTEGLADLRIPADLTPEQEREGRALATRAFAAVGASGLARVDLFVRRSDGRLLLNEINTMPGFTRTSMFPKVWEAGGVPYPDLIRRLIELALERHREERRTDIPRSDGAGGPSPAPLPVV